MKNKRLVICLGTVLVASTLITGCGRTSKLKAEKTTAVAVKGNKITADQFYKELKKNSIEKLINMLDHKILDKKYPTTDSEDKSVEEQIEKIKSYYKDNEANYLAAIKSYFNVESEEELRVTLSLEYKRGLAVDDYLQKKLTDDEINKYYEENIYGDIKASHILISVNTTDKMSDTEKEEAKKKALGKANNIIKKLDKGAKFSDLAKKYSDDSATANKGGNLGYFNSDKMDASFWNAASKLEKNKYTEEAVESSYGYHIILKTGEKDKKSLKSVKSTIKKNLAKDKLNNDKALYYKALKDFREEKKITFGDSDLEKQYDDYMQNLIDNANSSSTSN